jgi:putative glutamine amidotransferase
MKKIAVTLSTDREGQPYDFLKHSYVQYLEKFGLVPILVPNCLADPGLYFLALGVEGLILTGGGDVDPARYSQENRASREISPQRDQTEAVLVQIAVDRGLPVLGICRGMQALNVYLGGRLVQDIPTEIGGAASHGGGVHPISIRSPRLARVLGSERLDVNSYHHQGVTADGVAPGLEAFALCDDGIVEGIWHPTRPILGVQWHPERLSPSAEADLRLLRHVLQKTLW